MDDTLDDDLALFSWMDPGLGMDSGLGMDAEDIDPTYMNHLDGQVNGGQGMDTDAFFSDGPPQVTQTFENVQSGTMVMNQNQDGAMNTQLPDVNGQLGMQVEMDLSMAQYDSRESVGIVECAPQSPAPSPEPVDVKATRDNAHVQSVVESVVSRSWNKSEPAIKFIAEARKSFAELSLKSGDPDQVLDQELEDFVMNHMLTKAVTVSSSKGIVEIEVPSARMMSYIRSSVAERLISQRVALRVLVNAGSQEGRGYSDRARREFASLCAEIVPWYDITEDTSSGIHSECVEYLAAITMLLQMSTQFKSLVRETVQALSCDRVVALARCAGRRVPDSWTKCMEAVRAVESVPGVNAALMGTITKFREGLYSSFEDPDYTRLLGGVFTVISVAEWQLKAGAIAAPVLGKPVVKHLLALWNENEAEKGDCQALMDLEQTAEKFSETGTTLQEKVRICELLVYNAARASSLDSQDTWKIRWGGMHRLLRLIRDALPQAKPHLSSDVSSLIVACGVVGCCAVVFGMGTGRNLQTDDGVECSVGLRGFAIAYLEEVLSAEDSVEWRPFGVWLLLLASRCGNLLKGGYNPKCPGDTDHVRASKALRDWSLFGGTAVSSAVPANGLKLGNYSVGSIAMESAMRVIDAADETGSDDTLIELCSDLVVSNPV